MRFKIFITGILLVLVTISFAKDYTVLSPDKNLAITVSVDKEIKYGVTLNGKEALAPSAISMTLEDGTVLGAEPRARKAKTKSVDETIKPVVKEKRALIRDQYNQLLITFKNNYALEFRAYNDGAAYRFITSFNNELTVKNELVEYRFADQDSIFFPFESSFHTSYEKLYVQCPVNSIIEGQMGYLPVLVEKANGVQMVITEVNINDYPGLYLKGTNDPSATLVSTFPHVALRENQTRDRTVVVTETADYIAKTSGSRTFPWRAMVISEKAGTFIESDMVYRLADPLEIKDTSWIKPGKVAWDWWNANNLYGVDFVSGVNTQTYKYYIDFAAEHGLSYIILDEGWSDPADMTKINPDMDMQELFAYGKSKNVKIILWCVWVTVDKQMDEVFPLFEKWGAAGVKIDFMDRDDQKIVNWYRKVLKKAAEHHLLVDYHGAYKPDGIRRAYPNMVTREGVKGNEYNKWSKEVTPDHDLIIPFTRMLAGPMDYTPGAMRNANQNNFNAVHARPMSQGTRCLQLAMYVIYDSPVQMLCDSPSNYEHESKETQDYLSAVPVGWDETIALDGQAGDYVVVARKSGDDWYIGAMTDWTPRELTFTLDFLPEGEYHATLFEDGVNADKFAEDYKYVQKTVTSGQQITIKLAPGGGWVAKLSK